MGRGGDSDTVPVLRATRGRQVPLTQLRKPGAGYDHKRLTMGETYVAPVRSGGLGGAQRPQPRHPDRSRNGVVGNRGKTGRANVGVSNRRSTEMPMEVLNSTGKVALNVSGLVNTEGTYHYEKRKAHMPGRETKQPNLTNGFRVVGAKIVERELAGPPGVGKTLTRESNLGDIPADMSVMQPEPTSGRGRMSQPIDKANGAEATRLDAEGNAVPLVKYEPTLDQELVTRGKKIVTAEARTEKSAAKKPSVPVRAQPYKLDEKKLIRPKEKKPLPSRWKLGPVHIIPDLRGQQSNFRLTVQPMDLLTEPLKRNKKKDGVGMSGKQLLMTLAKWVETRSGNFAKVFRAFDEDHNGTVSTDEFKRGLDMMGFKPTEAEFQSLMKIVDKDGSGEIDYEEFASKMTKMLGDEGDANMFDSISDEEEVERPVTASASSRPSTADGSRMKYEVLYDPIQSPGPRPKSAPLPAGITKGSWLSRNTDAVAMVGHTVDQATEWKGMDKKTVVRKAFSVEDDIDNRWSFEALRDVNEQIEYAQLRIPPAPNQKYAPKIQNAGVGSLYEKLRDMAPKVADAFIKHDTDRSGKLDQEEFRQVLYSLNVPMTEAQVERVFQSFDSNNNNAIEWTEFVDQIDPRSAKNWTPRGQYSEFSTQGAPPVRVPKAVQLLPKTDTQPLITHPPRPQTWTAYGEQPPYSALNSAQITRHMKSAPEFGTVTAYHVTKDGISPGSSIDFYETETRWVDRYNNAAKQQKKDRAKARGERTANNMARIKAAYQSQADRDAEKVARRQESFKKQKQRYNRRMRAMDPWNNAQIRNFHGQDTSSAMWATLDDDHPALQGVVLAGPEQTAAGKADAHGLNVQYGEVGKPMKKRINAAQRHAAAYRKERGSEDTGGLANLR